MTGSTDVRAYAGTYRGGYAFMLFNLNQNANRVSISGKSSGSGGAVVTYDKRIYRKSARNVWDPPHVTSLASWNNSIELRLLPWSMVVVQTQTTLESKIRRIS